MAVLLYDLPLSHFCVKVKRILEYKRIPFETEYAPYHDRQDLLAVSGQDYVPYLLWEDKGVAWYDIPDALEAKAPTPTLYPGGQKGLAKMLEAWAHDVVEEAAWKVCLNDAIKTFKDPREAWVFEEMQSRKRGSLEVMAMRKGEFVKGLVDTLQPTELRLSEAPFLLGNEPSLADFALYGALHVLPYTGNEIPKALPATRAWFARVAKL